MDKTPATLTTNFIKENADFHYTSSDNRLSVWAWHQMVLVEVSGIWTPDVTKYHLMELQRDFLNLKKKWEKIFAIIDLSQFGIQSEEFRHYVKTRWEKVFNRTDLVILFVEDNALRYTIRRSILQLIKKSKDIHVFRDFQKVFDFISQYAFDKEPEKKNSLESAQNYISDQLSRLAASKLVHIDDLVWDQRENDWQSEVHYLAVYITDVRYALAFSQMELTIDQGTKIWERMIRDKLQWFLLEYIPTKQPQRYQHLDAGKAWIEAQLIKLSESMGGKRNISIKIENWQNPDDLQLARSSELKKVSLTIVIAGREESLLFTAHEVQECVKSKDIQDKISRYLEAKLIYTK
jgi:hypothetical protein